MANTDGQISALFYHGTRADLKVGDLIEAGYVANFGDRNKSTYVYLTGTLDAAIWGAELARGDGSRQNLCRRTDRLDRGRSQSHEHKVSGQSDEVVPLARAAACHGRGR